MRYRLLLAVALAAAGARASNVSDQISINSTQATDSNPRSGNVSDNLSATFDLSESWSLNAGVTATAESATAAARQVGTGSSILTMFSAGVDWDATDNWSFGLDLDFSPATTQQAASEITVGSVNAIAVIDSKTSEFDAGLDVSYDTGGVSDLEWYLSLGVAGTHESADQSVTRIGKATLPQLRQACAAQPSRLICKAITPVAVTLDSEKLSLAATATAWRDTDLTLSGDFYHYEQDPRSVLYPSLVATHLGMGMTIAPLQYLARVEVLHRFGDFQAKVWVQGGQYEAGTADSTKAIGLKLQYKFTKSFKMWLSASGQSDISDADATTAAQTIKSSTVAMGGQYRF
ncbi:MAG: hypothetical protein LC689_21720 [Myxococcales bacterium]|nr:hypothetical protein [Myxococcales bacterium]